MIPELALILLTLLGGLYFLTKGINNYFDGPRPK